MRLFSCAKLRSAREARPVKTGGEEARVSAGCSTAPRRRLLPVVPTAIHTDEVSPACVRKGPGPSARAATSGLLKHVVLVGVTRFAMCSRAWIGGICPWCWRQRPVQTQAACTDSRDLGGVGRGQVLTGVGPPGQNEATLNVTKKVAPLTKQTGVQVPDAPPWIAWIDHLDKAPNVNHLRHSIPRLFLATVAELVWRADTSGTGGAEL